MSDLELSVDRQFELADPAVAAIMDQMTEPLSEGWGVFRDVSGLAQMPYSDLVDVKATQEQADQEAAYLDRTEGRIEYDSPFDPESPIYEQVSFSTGYVALSGAKVKVQVVSKYERREAPTDTSESE